MNNLNNKQGCCTRLKNGILIQQKMTLDEFTKKCKKIGISHGEEHAVPDKWVKQHPNIEIATVSTAGYHCPCGTKIYKGTVMYNTYANNTFIIGNTCVKRFLPEKFRKKTCDMCDAVHRNTKDNFCNGCRDKIKNNDWERNHWRRIGEKWKVFTPKYKRTCMTYDEVWDIDKQYLIWMYNNKKIKKNEIKAWMEVKLFDEKMENI